MKNIVFIIAFKKDGQLKKEYQISIDSWKHFCKKYDAELLLMEEPVMDIKDMHIIWQRYFLFDILDSNEIDYNIFNDQWFDFWEYGNSGFQIVNKKHRPFFDSMRKLYFEHQQTIQAIQTNYGIGTDQTPLNFMLRKHNIGLKLLPWKYNMTCMPKREVLGEDMLHTRMGYVMHFNGLPEKDKSVPYWMEKTYKELYNG